MIVDPVKTNLPTVALTSGRYAIRRRNGKVKECSPLQWAEWTERNGLQPIHAEGKTLPDGSILSVIAAFFGQSLFESPRGFYWWVVASVGGQEATWYTDSEAAAVELAKHVARVGIEEQAMFFPHIR